MRGEAGITTALRNMQRQFTNFERELHRSFILHPAISIVAIAYGVAASTSAVQPQINHRNPVNKERQSRAD